RRARHACASKRACRQRSAAPRGLIELVVPAKAGTHNHGRFSDYGSRLSLRHSASKTRVNALMAGTTDIVCLSLQRGWATIRAREDPMRSRRYTFIAALGGLLCAIGAAAQDYPSRPVNMVIPFPPGGNTDLMARALQPELAKALGQPVVVVNKGGAGGTIGDIEV